MTTPEPALRSFYKCVFSPMKLKPESGPIGSRSADDAYSFMMHMRLSYQNKPHCRPHGTRSTKPACQTTAKSAWRSFRRGGSGRLAPDRNNGAIYFRMRRSSLDRSFRKSSKAYLPANWRCIGLKPSAVSLTPKGLLLRRIFQIQRSDLSPVGRKHT